MNNNYNWFMLLLTTIIQCPNLNFTMQMVPRLGEIHIVMGDLLFFLRTHGVWVLQGTAQSPILIRHNQSDDVFHRYYPSILRRLQRHRDREDDLFSKPNCSSVLAISFHL